uniref:Uncharacterized protein n=1 Tax=Cucumis melo TaxID=3656 RepID=A0A9I9EEL0_CUCME
MCLTHAPSYLRLSGDDSRVPSYPTLRYSLSLQISLFYMACLLPNLLKWVFGVTTIEDRLQFSNISSKASELGVCPYTGQWLEIESNMRWLSKTYTYNIIFHTNDRNFS